ncbi:MAG: lysophospholipid acyltransferase family protein [Bacteroidetes bacterium]|nr:lysophospholipid acyltransferase family protein [Bacteroidota bacterium]
MIVRTHHHWFLYPFFRWYGRRALRKHFASITLRYEVNDSGLPILLIQNHWSWWDGFFASYVNDVVFRRRFHFLMLEHQLKKYWYFRYVGGYSINPTSRTVVESLEYTVELLNNPRNIVLLFPQGDLISQHEHTIYFKRGIEYILQRVSSTISIVLCATFIDYFASRKPHLSISLRSIDGTVAQRESIEQVYQAFYNESLQRHILRGG